MTEIWGEQKMSNTDIECQIPGIFQYSKSGRNDRGFGNWTENVNTSHYQILDINCVFSQIYEDIKTETTGIWQTECQIQDISDKYLVYFGISTYLWWIEQNNEIWRERSNYKILSVKYLLYFVFYKSNTRIWQKFGGIEQKNVKYTILVSNTWYISVFPKN
jgi:hypothetical protein